MKHLLKLSDWSGEEITAALDLAANCNDVINALELLVIQTHRHAQLAQVAIGAGYFDGLQVGRHGYSVHGTDLQPNVTETWDVAIR